MLSRATYYTFFIYHLYQLITTDVPKYSQSILFSYCSGVIMYKPTNQHDNKQYLFMAVCYPAHPKFSFHVRVTSENKNSPAIWLITQSTQPGCRLHLHRINKKPGQDFLMAQIHGGWSGFQIMTLTLDSLTKEGQHTQTSQQPLKLFTIYNPTRARGTGACQCALSLHANSLIPVIQQWRHFFYHKWSTHHSFL